jgi:sulfite oxidase
MSDPLRPAGMNRRGFIAAAAGIAAAAALPSGGRRLLQANGYPIDAETPLDQLTSYITPNDLFFVRSHWNPTMPDRATWALTVDGEVEKPLRLALEDLARMPQASATCVLQCAGNGRALHKPVVPGVQWRAGAVGNARWTGVRVRDLLERAGVRPGARHVHTFGSDDPPQKVPPFHRSVEIEKLLADGIVATGMNGTPLAPLHGAPARLVVPGWAGDHWMKWLTRLSPQPEPQKGFYMDVAYRYPKKPGEPGVAFKPEEMEPVTALFVKSSITESPSAARVGSPVMLRGFAFSGAPDVASVEVSDDGGAQWRPAELGREHDSYAWRRWTFRYTPRSAGTATLWVRATDSRGSVQPRDAVWNQSGYLYNAWPSASFEVRS